MLTKEQKLDAYTYAMFQELCNEDAPEDYWCVCDSLASSLDNGYYTFCFDFPYSINSFPEFLRQKPENAIKGFMWWDKFSPLRLQTIERAIELTEKL